MNDFDQDIRFSHASEDLPIWEEVYRRAFPRNKGFFSQRKNGELQQLGVDRTIILWSGKAIYVDEKVRRKDYGDILIEYMANDNKQSPGWAEKPLFADFIAYAILPRGTCYMLPVPQLQSVWAENKEDWLNRYHTKSANNQTYNTLNCPVPVDVLFPKLGKALRVPFGVLL